MKKLFSSKLSVDHTCLGNMKITKGTSDTKLSAMGRKKSRWPGLLISKLYQ